MFVLFKFQDSYVIYGSNKHFEFERKNIQKKPNTAYIKKPHRKVAQMEVATNMLSIFTVLMHINLKAIL